MAVAPAAPIPVRTLLVPQDYLELVQARAYDGRQFILNTVTRDYAELPRGAA